MEENYIKKTVHYIILYGSLVVVSLPLDLNELHVSLSMVLN